MWPAQSGGGFPLTDHAESGLGGLLEFARVHRKNFYSWLRDGYRIKTGFHEKVALLLSLTVYSHTGMYLCYSLFIMGM